MNRYGTGGKRFKAEHAKGAFVFVFRFHHRPLFLYLKNVNRAYLNHFLGSLYPRTFLLIDLDLDKFSHLSPIPSYLSFFQSAYYPDMRLVCEPTMTGFKP